MARVKDTLVYVRCTRDPVSLLSRCDEALHEARELLAHEKRGVADIRPSPASLLAMLEAKREEVEAELRSAESARNRRSSASRGDFAAIAPPDPGEPGREIAAAGLDDSADPSSAKDRGDEWWAWRLENDAGPEIESGSDEGAAGLAVRPLRERLHCLVLLHPGGIRATLENISMGGLFLSTPRVRPPGSRVRVILNTPDGPVQAEGVVRWVRKDAGRGGPPQPPGMGIEFTTSPPTLADFLRARFPSLHAASSAAFGG